MEEYPYDKSIVKKIQNYKYIGGDTSIIYQYILSPFAQFCVNLMPTWLAPNLITALGLLLPTIITILTIIFNPFLNSIYAPRWLYLFNGITLFMYQTMDNMDGKQARRTGTSSPLGMLFDHGCDAMQSCISSISMASVLGIGWPGAFSMFLLVGYPFFMSTWEHYHIGEMFLPIINGPTEGLLLGTILCSISYCYGCQWWHKPLTYTASYIYIIPKMLEVKTENSNYSTYLHYYFKDVLNVFSNSYFDSNVDIVGEDYYNNAARIVKIIGRSISWFMNIGSIGILRCPCMYFSSSSSSSSSSGSSSSGGSISGILGESVPNILVDLDLIINDDENQHDAIENERFKASHIGVVFSATPFDLFFLFSNICVCSTLVTHIVRTFMSNNKKFKMGKLGDDDSHSAMTKLKHLYPIIALTSGIYMFLQENVVHLTSSSLEYLGVHLYTSPYSYLDMIAQWTLTWLLDNQALVYHGCIFLIISLSFTDVCIGLQTCEISAFTFPWYNRCYTGYLLSLLGMHRILIQIYSYLSISSTNFVIDDYLFASVIYSSTSIFFMLWYYISFKKITTNELNKQYNEISSIWGLIRLMLRLSSVGIIIIVCLNVASHLYDQRRSVQEFTMLSYLHIALLLLAGVLDALSMVPFLLSHYVNQVREALKIKHVFKI